MMEKLIARGEKLAAEAQERQARRLTQQLRQLFGSAAIETQRESLVVAGRGMFKRWLTDPAVRFLAGALK